MIAINDRLRKLRNLLSFRELHMHLYRVLKGYYNYYGFAGNAATLNKFAYAVEHMWIKWLNGRSQRKSFNWEEFKERLKHFPLPRPRIVKGYTWIYTAGLWTCLKSRMREIRKYGSVRGRGQRIHG